MGDLNRFLNRTGRTLLLQAAGLKAMWYEVKFGLIGFLVGTVAISATTFASNLGAAPSAVAAKTPAPMEHLALLPTPKPHPAAVTVAQTKADASAPAKPMSAWRRAYIAKHGHQPPVPAA
jgi:hypothetical protein